MIKKLRLLDLFSGIGGFSLGLENTGFFKTVAFCESDNYCQRVLLRHWPKIICYPDINCLSYNLLAKHGIEVDIVTGGFPCQPFSTASRGKSYGTKDSRYLWPEMLRIVKEVRPRWVVCENVVRLQKMALEQVVIDLEESGYRVLPIFEIPACGVGQDHRRNRIWICAYTNSYRKHAQSKHEKTQKLYRLRQHARNIRAAHGFSDRVVTHRRRVIGNAIIPEIASAIGLSIIAFERKTAENLPVDSCHGF